MRELMIAAAILAGLSSVFTICVLLLFWGLGVFIEHWNQYKFSISEERWSNSMESVRRWCGKEYPQIDLMAKEIQKSVSEGRMLDFLAFRDKIRKEFPQERKELDNDEKKEEDQWHIYCQMYGEVIPAEYDERFNLTKVERLERCKEER